MAAERRGSTRLAAAALSTIAAVTLAAATPPRSEAATTPQGRLSGSTQISFGCPGPAREGVTCNPWHAFPNASFTVTRRSASGRPILSTRRLVSSDANGHFSLRLRAATYLVTPLPQKQTHGGSAVVVRVRAGHTAAIVLRFVGFPQMV
jgi:hypothetical protein